MNHKIITYLQVHLYELKYNLIIFLFTFFYLFLICYFFSDQLIFLFSKKLIQSSMLKYFIFTNITEMFMTNLLITFIISFFLSFQLFLMQFWFFISNGLFKYENLKIIKFYIIFIIFNIFIINIILIKIIPNIWFFFIKNTFSNTYLFNIYFEPKLSNYFNFIFFSFIYIYILFFYFFLLIYILFNKIFDIKTIINLRKIFYLKFLILATCVAPPDIISQLILTFCFIFLFELYIYIYLFLCRYFFI